MGNELTTFEMFEIVVCFVGIAFWGTLGIVGGLLAWHEKLFGEGSRN